MEDFKLSMNEPLNDRERYKKYNTLIEYFRKSIIDQRLEDLKILNNLAHLSHLG